MPPENLSSFVLSQKPRTWVLRFNRPEARNAINRALLVELNTVLDAAAKDADLAMIVLEGDKNFFCSGMDFRELTGALASGAGGQEVEAYTSLYMKTLKRFTDIPKWIAAKIEGRVNAGGVGFAAACDFVLAAPEASFSLSEILFGLLPASVVPFLIRRVGFQKTYLMTLLAKTVPASEALQMGLVDELANVESLDESIRKLLIRVGRVKPEAMAHAKKFFTHMSGVNESMTLEATRTITRLIQDPKNQASIKSFLSEGNG